ncbi:MAG: hypothetical protein ACOC9W_03580 [Persicimonas sp.]
MALLFCVGCPGQGQDSSSGPVDTCETAGEQCRLGGGQLGVCSPKADGQLECMSQH